MTCVFNTSGMCYPMKLMNVYTIKLVFTFYVFIFLPDGEDFVLLVWSDFDYLNEF